MAQATPKYTKPALREKLKKQLTVGSNGGRAGQWSARKSQLLVQEYEKHGNSYRGKKDAGAKHLETWTEEHWQTKSGKSRARHGKVTERYLPEKAWGKLTPAEKLATDSKKRKASKKGKQFVANTAAAKRARKSTRVK
jgi:hypothetical protein